MDLSVVVPLFNEEESAPILYQSIVDVVSKLDIDYEIIFVDDGSRDSTFEKAKSIAKIDHHLKVIKFRRNYGQTPAMAAGIDHAVGKIVITMDGDLQNDPIDIPAFLEKINEGFDIVVGWRHKRQDKLVSRKIPSKIANWLIGKVTGVPIKDNGCSLKAYRGDVIKNVPLYSEMHRFIPAMASLAGSRVAEIKVRHHARQFGESKYGLNRIFKVLSDLLSIKTIVSFASKPMLWFSILALPLVGLALITAVMFFVIWFSAEEVSLVVLSSLIVIFFATSFFLFMCGVLGELIYKTSDSKIEKLALLTMRKEKEQQ